MTGATPLLSLAVAVPIATVIGSTAAASTETSAGAVIAGGVLSAGGGGGGACTVTEMSLKSVSNMPPVAAKTRTTYDPVFAGAVKENNAVPLGADPT
jgi:hypothetical protein